MERLTTQEKLDLYYLARNVIWRYELDQFEEEVIKRIDAILSKLNRELSTRLNDYAAKSYSKQRIEDLLAEIEVLSAATHMSMSNTIAEASGAVGYFSLAEQSDILSVGGRSTKIKGIGMGASDFSALFLASPLGGKMLQGWVDSTLGAGQDAIREAINKGLFLGEGYPGIIRRVLKESDNITRREAITLVRTYVASAHSTACEAVYAENANSVSWLKWSAILEPGYIKTGRGTCLRCSALDGQRWKYGEEHPPWPLHPNCLTGETTVFAPDKIAAFISSYDGPICEIGLSNGARFSVTANHMFLTTEGFVPAYLLNKGTKVLHNPMLKGIVDSQPNNNRNPFRIDETVESFSKASGMGSRSVPMAPEHLHGDGEFIKGDINIIAPNSLLKGDFEAFFDEHGSKLPFAFCSPSEFGLLAQGLPMQLLFALKNAANGGVGGLSVFEVFLRSSGHHHEPVSSNNVSGGDSSLQDTATDSPPANPMLLGQSFFRRPREILFNEILNRERNSFFKLDRGPSPYKNALTLQNRDNGTLGIPEVIRDLSSKFSAQVSFADVSFNIIRDSSCQVYDLQTLTTLYHVDGALSSNCRCLLLPVADWSFLGIPDDALDEAVRPYTIRPDKNIGAGGTRTIIEAGQHQGDYASWFEKRGKGFKLNVLGAKRYELYQQGMDFSKFVDSKTGDLLTIKELEGKNAR